MAQSSDNRVLVSITFGSLVKIVVVAALAYTLFRLAPLVLLLVLSTFLAIALQPIVVRLQKWGIRRGYAVAGIATSMCILAAIFSLFVLPPLVDQLGEVVKKAPELMKSLEQKLPPAIRMEEVGSALFGGGETSQEEGTATSAKKSDGGKMAWLSPVVSAGQTALGGLANFLIVLVFTLYLLVDGPRVYQWLLAFVPDHRREKAEATSVEASQVISAYVIANLSTSALCTAFTLIVLVLLKVPAALALAILAGVLNLLPVLGFFISTVPAVLMAMTVDLKTGIWVTAFYVAYNILENYFIVPKVYGNRLRVSDFVVLVSLLFAGALGGVVGAILALPIVASYPIIERYWLGEVLGRKVVSEHHRKKPTKD